MESVKEENKKLTQEELKGEDKDAAEEDEEEDPTAATTDAVF